MITCISENINNPCLVCKNPYNYSSSAKCYIDHKIQFYKECTEDLFISSFSLMIEWSITYEYEETFQVVLKYLTPSRLSLANKIMLLK